jgi:hypothetical protein
MGRGRAKAKQVKVARQLKYNGGGTDLNRLRQELGVGTEAQSSDHDDPYAEYDDEDALDDDAGDEDDDEDDWSRSLGHYDPVARRESYLSQCPRYEDAGIRPVLSLPR